VIGTHSMAAADTRAEWIIAAVLAALVSGGVMDIRLLCWAVRRLVTVHPQAFSVREARRHESRFSTKQYTLVLLILSRFAVASSWRPEHELAFVTAELHAHGLALRLRQPAHVFARHVRCGPIAARWAAAIGATGVRLQSSMPPLACACVLVLIMATPVARPQARVERARGARLPKASSSLFGFTWARLAVVPWWDSVQHTSRLQTAATRTQGWRPRTVGHLAIHGIGALLFIATHAMRRRACLAAELWEHRRGWRADTPTSTTAFAARALVPRHFAINGWVLTKLQTPSTGQDTQVTAVAYRHRLAHHSRAPCEAQQPTSSERDALGVHREMRI